MEQSLSQAQQGALVMTYLRLGKRNRLPGTKAPLDGAPAPRRVHAGIVKWFDQIKGFGFIEPLDGSADIFVSLSAIHRSGLHGIQQGQCIEYSLSVDHHGKSRADNLKCR